MVNNTTQVEFVQNSLVNLTQSKEQSIYSLLLNDIAKGYFVSGDRLVTTQLAKRYNTSINPIRESLKQLEGEGFVTFQKNSGARVATFAYSTMRNVFEILRLLEPYLLEGFFTHFSQDKIDNLVSLVEQMEQLAVNDFTRFRELDTEFHWQLYRHHYNADAVNLWRKNKLVLQALHANLAISEGRFQQTLKEHRIILRALKEGNSELANQALVNHIQSGGKYWANLIDSQQSATTQQMGAL